MNMNRSFSLFLVITKFLCVLAIGMLLTTSYDVVNAILQLDEELSNRIRKLLNATNLVIAVLIAQCCMICICGLYGFARFNRHMLFFYGLSLIMLTLWSSYFTILITLGEHETESKVELFMNLKADPIEHKAVDILQQAHRCCGSSYYKYEDREYYPNSCCDSNTLKGEKCVPAKAFNDSCVTRRTTILMSIGPISPQMIVVIIAFLITTGMETFMSFFTVYRLSVDDFIDESYDEEERY